MPTDEHILQVARDYATDYFNRTPIYTWELEKQGFKDEDFAGWNVEAGGRIIHTVKGVRIDERDEEQGTWIVEVDLTPEVPDLQLFEVTEMDDGSLQVEWHGC